MEDNIYFMHSPLKHKVFKLRILHHKYIDFKVQF